MAPPREFGQQALGLVEHARVRVDEVGANHVRQQSCRDLPSTGAQVQQRRRRKPVEQ
ncbi:hypothetical protein ABZ667_08630 [Streptomyces lavendulae]|uniref:hypothetical protein n=1 Tax=Streptomyces lavendulae TaxID=1914 RepID=UPI00340A6840